MVNQGRGDRDRHYTDRLQSILFWEDSPGGYGVGMGGNVAAEPYGSVRHAYDTVAEDYAALIPDTRAEVALDLAMVDAFAEGVAAGGLPDPAEDGLAQMRILDAILATARR